MSKLITGNIYKDMIIEACHSMEENSVRANELNVFPVPDGDTGTNMSHTMQNAMLELSKLNQDLTLGKSVETTASALLRGARGNSGVIISIIFRGVAKILGEHENANGYLLAKAFREGVANAYDAVMKPAEGTILTVSRVSADHALKLCEQDENLSAETVLREIILSAEKALIETEFQNPVLQKAKVVDAGAFGYIKILEGMKDGLLGIKRQQKIHTSSTNTATFSDISSEDITFTYCTEFIVEHVSTNRNVDRFRKFLGEIGDSLVVVADESMIKVHVHTDNPDKALAEGLKFGELTAIKIDNMRKQHTAKIIPETEGKVNTNKIADPEKKFGFVVVSSGKGLTELFLEIGVDNVVEGGQSMNPSTNDILHAVNSTPAEVVFVLPNNKNIIMAAEQVKVMSEHKKVIVIPTKTIPQGISALLAFNEEMRTTQNAELMHNAISQVKTGMVTYAARNSEFDGKKIREGELICLIENKLCSHSKREGDAIKKLAKEMVKKSGSFATIFYGEGVKEEHALHVVDIFKKENPNLEINVVNGGQPVYYFIISVE